MSRQLNHLTPERRVKAIEFLARLTEARIHVVLVDTLRTVEEHEANVAAGRSWTKLSRHLPRSMRVEGSDEPGSDAIDVARR